MGVYVSDLQNCSLLVLRNGPYRMPEAPTARS